METKTWERIFDMINWASIFYMIEFDHKFNTIGGMAPEFFDDKFKTLTDVIKLDNRLNALNIIDKIKERLRYIYASSCDMSAFTASSQFMSASTVSILLSIAAANKNSVVLQTLLDAGADINVQIDGGTALRAALYSIYSLDGSVLYDENREKVTKPLIAYEIKLRDLRAKESKLFIEHDYKDIFSTQELEHCHQCIEEVERMKKEKIGSNVTFYDILTSKNNELASHIRRIKVLGNDYKNKFPIYANDLERQFKIGNKRLDALNISEIVTKHFDGFTQKDGPFNLQIAKYLNNEDIKNLRRAAIQTMDNDISVVTEANEGYRATAASNQDSETAAATSLKDIEVILRRDLLKERI